MTTEGDIIAAVSASGDKHVIPDDRIEEISEYVMKLHLKYQRPWAT